MHDSVADEFVRRVQARVQALRVGRGTDPGVDIGPLIDGRAVAKADALIRDAVARGAHVVTGGSPEEGPGHFFPPTVLDAVVTGSHILREEIFGPVLTVSRFHTEAEACAIANDTEYGLAAYVFTRDLARGQRMIDRLHTGMLGLNVGVLSDAAAPSAASNSRASGVRAGSRGSTSTSA